MHYLCCIWIFGCKSIKSNAALSGQAFRLVLFHFVVFNPLLHCEFLRSMLVIKGTRIFKLSTVMKTWSHGWLCWIDLLILVIFFSHMCWSALKFFVWTKKTVFYLKTCHCENQKRLSTSSGDKLQMKQMNVCQLFAQVLFKMATNSSYRMFKLSSQIFSSVPSTPKDL